MSEVRKYGLVCEMVEENDGGWVSVDSYDALKADNARLREALLEVKATLQSQTETVRTHWQGCESHHPLCRTIKTIDAALAPQEKGYE